MLAGPMPAAWRRCISPACPNCRREADDAVHWRCGGDLYLDIATGDKHCLACAQSWPLHDTTHHCTVCRAVYTGGEIWEGMAAEAVQVGDLAWFAAAGLRQGTMDVALIGWDLCFGCGQERVHGPYFDTGLRHGGLCRRCIDLAARRFFYGRLTFQRTKRPCTACGYVERWEPTPFVLPGLPARKRRLKVVKLRQGQVCEICVGAAKVPLHERWAGI